MMHPAVRVVILLSSGTHTTGSLSAVLDKRSFTWGEIFLQADLKKVFNMCENS